MHPVGDDACRRCDDRLPIPTDGFVLDAETSLCDECATELALAPFTVTGMAVVIEAAGMPELGTARVVLEWLDADTLVEQQVSVWLEGRHAPEQYALALGSHAMGQRVHAIVTIRPRTGTADLNELGV